MTASGEVGWTSSSEVFSTDWRKSEVFSTDWWFGGGQDECRFSDGADSLRAQSDAAQRLPAGLEQRDPAFSLSAQTAEEQVAGEVVRVQVAALGGGQHSGTGAVVALVGQAGQAQQGGRGVQRAQEAGGPAQPFGDQQRGQQRSPVLGHVEVGE